MKRRLLFLLVSGISFINAQILSDKNQKKDMNSRTFIAFDLHEVVFEFSYSKLCNSVCRFMYKNPYAITLCNPFAGYRVAKTFYNDSKTAESVYDNLTRRHYKWLADSRTEFLTVCNSYTLDPEMKKLLEELRAQGYRLAICSNIGQHAFEAFREEHPEIFQMFDVIVTSHPERNYSRKPAPEFFDHLKKEVKAVAHGDDTRIIFIDDKKKNAAAAQKQGIEGLVFKKPAQLRKHLKEIGIAIY